MPVIQTRSPGGATEALQTSIRSDLAAILTELGQKLETGQAVALDAGTLAALESITATIAGTVSVTGPLTDIQLRAADVNTADSGEREYTHVVATVTASGNTTIHTPAAGKSIVLRWIYTINDPSAASAPLIRISLGASEKYRVYALSKRQKVTGPVNGALVINLSAASSGVAVTALLEEV